MIGYPNNQMTMYQGYAYQRGSPDRESGNRAVEYMANHWMMQCHPWLRPCPHCTPIYVEFLSLGFKSPKVVSHCICILPGANQLLFRQSYRHQEQSFKACISLSLPVNVKTQCNTIILTPLWSRLLWSGLRILAVELDQMGTYLIPKN